MVGSTHSYRVRGVTVLVAGLWISINPCMVVDKFAHVIHGIEISPTFEQKI